MGIVKQSFMQKPIDNIFILTLVAQNINKNWIFLLSFYLIGLHS
jgi:hypothetical protein